MSVIVPTYQRFDEVQEAVNSALKQTVPVEVIVVDDCSFDPRYLRLYDIYKNNPRVHIVCMSKNSKELSGASSAHGLTKNEGLKMSRGEWVAFLDDDDVFIDDDKIKRQIEYMDKNSCLMSSTNMVKGLPPYKYRYLYGDSDSVPYFSDFNHGIKLDDKAYRLSRDLVSEINLVNNSTVVLHRSVVEKTGLFNVCQYEDWDYWKRAMVYTDCIYLDIPMVYYSTGSIKKYT